MEEVRAERRITDLEFTKENGKRILVDAFTIAAVEELDNGSKLYLKVPVSTGSTSSYSKMYGLEVSVTESYDRIAEMRAALK